MSASLNNRRGGHRARVSKLIFDMETELRKEDYDVATLETFRAEITRQKEKILQLDELILDSLEEQQLINEDIESASDWLLKIDASIRRLNKVIDNTDSITTTTEVRRDINKTVKLPYIQLIKFSGDSLQWPKFWDLYKSSIHDREDLSGVTKFHYLLTQLTGEAEQLLAGFDHTDAEYEEAVALLKETYGKTQRLIQARLYALFDLSSPMPHSVDLSKFRSLYEGHLRGLKSLGADVEAAGYVFSELLVRKLPNKIRDNLNRSHKSDFWQLADLRREIDIEIGHLQSIEPIQDKVLLDTKIPASTSVFKATTNTIKCSFCSENHFSSNCTKYVKVESRKARIMELKLCYNCLRPNHSVKKCTNSGRCKLCNAKHNTSICSKKSRDLRVANSNSDSNSLQTMTVTSSAYQTSSNSIRSSIIPTALISILTSNNSTFKAKAILDTGSQTTFILKAVVDKIKLPISNRVTMSIDGFNSLGEPKEYDIVRFNITCNDGIMPISAIVIDALPSRINMPGRSDLIRKFISEGLILADPKTDSDRLTDVSLLIGVDYFFKLLGCTRLQDEVYGIPSRVGTVVGGNFTTSSNISACCQTTVLRIDPNIHETLDDKIQKLWQCDSIVTNTEFENSEIINKFESEISYSDGKYSVSLPWKPNHPPLPVNYFYAKSRLNSVLSSLRGNGVDLECYDKIIKDQLFKGFIEDVTDMPVNPNKVHYLAHRAVKKDSITTPLRIVYDCSAQPNKQKPSLNDCLYTGPNLMNDMCGVLLRFRYGLYAATSDIEKAFLHVGLNLEDRDATRFLWPEDPKVLDSPLKTYRFCSVLFGSTSSPFLLNATLKHHLKSKSSNLAKKLENNIYVDNLYLTDNSEHRLLQNKLEVTDILKAGGFMLHDWTSNSQLVADAGLSHDSYCNVLGLRWYFDNDYLSLAAGSLTISDVLTKRSIVSEVATMFDPLGFLLPITIKGRLIIQDLWKSRLSWDEQVPPDIEKLWHSYVFDLNSSLSITIPRVATTSSVVDLHVFSDSSNRAYGSVSYFKGNNSVNFVMAKCKIAPISSRTLPELELCAMLYSVQLASYLLSTYKSILTIKNCFIWTDSSIVLHWVNSFRNKRPFVRNKVIRIRELSDHMQLKYVNTASNPADLLTRGLSFKTFKSKLEYWFKGPEWIQDSAWPVPAFSLSCSSVCSYCNNDSTSVHEVNISSLRDSDPFDKFSSLDKLIRIYAYVLRFISNCKSAGSRTVGGLSVSEMEDSTRSLISQEQRRCYSDIFQYFRGTDNKSCPPLVRNLRIFISGGVLLCGGRIQNAKIDNSSKFPILLPPRCHIAELIIRKIHNRFHFGVNHVIAELRQNFWLPRARQNVKRVLRNCITCKKLQGRPYKPVDLPPLPNIRVSETVPFSVTCVDLTGALLVKENQSIVKYYIALFTCAVSRAVHLELVENLSAEAFIRALKRFSGRRSTPRILVSDNATNFVSSNNVLNQILDSISDNEYFHEHRIEWKFITPAAPWMGGVYERLIGITKNCIRKILGNSNVTFHELRTIIVQVEGAINDRPLTYISDDPGDLQPLTPSMLLCGHRINNLPDPINFDELSDPTFNSGSVITKRALYLSKLMKDFSKRWQNEYLLSLREKDRNVVKNNSNQISVGKVVVIHDECARQFWRMGIVTDLICGADGRVRSAVLKTSSGSVTRPVVKLYSLELDVSEEFCRSKKEETPLNSRPVRASAQEAMQKLKSIFN